MKRESKIHFVATGGIIPSHDEQTFPHFRTLVSQSAVSDHFHLLDWVDAGCLQDLYLAADLGINIEKSLYERRFGSENRAVHWAVNGLPCITTARSELGRYLVDNGMAFHAEPDAVRLAELIVQLSGDRQRVKAAGEACLRHGRHHFSYSTTAEPLVQWCRQPHFARDRGKNNLSSELAAASSEMDSLVGTFLQSLSLGKAAGLCSGWLWKRLSRGGR